MMSSAYSRVVVTYLIQVYIDTYSDPCQISKMERCAKIINGVYLLINGVNFLAKFST